MGFCIDKERYAKDAFSLSTDGALHYPALKEVIIGTFDDGIGLQHALLGNAGEVIQRSIGWLAREGKIILDTIDRFETIGLTG